MIFSNSSIRSATLRQAQAIAQGDGSGRSFSSRGCGRSGDFFRRGAIGGAEYAHDGQLCVGEQGVEGRVVKVEGQVSLSFDVQQGLAGGQVADGDFVSLPLCAGENDVAADRRVGIIRGSFLVKEAAFGDVDAVFQDGQARRWPIHPHGDGIVLLPWGEVYGGFFERFALQGVDHDAGWDGILFCVGATIAIGYACLTNKKPGARWR